MPNYCNIVNSTGSS